MGRFTNNNSLVLMQDAQSQNLSPTRVDGSVGIIITSS